MLRILSTTARTSLLRAAQTPLMYLRNPMKSGVINWQVRFLSQKQGNDSDDDVAIVPEGRKKKLPTEPNGNLRAILDPMKFIPVTEHLPLYDVPFKVDAGDAEFKVKLRPHVLEYIKVPHRNQQEFLRYFCIKKTRRCRR